MCGQSIESVVIVFPGALGDFLLALPALRALRTRHADARCTLVVNETLRGLARVSGIADVTAALESADAAALFGGDHLPAWLAERPLVYSWLGARDAGVRRRLAGAARAVRFFAVERGPGPVHAAVAYARAVHAPGSRRSLAAGTMLVPPASHAADALFEKIPAPVLAIHVGAGARPKRWDVAGFVQVAHWWRSTGGSVLAIFGPAEAGEPPALGTPEVRDWPLLDLAAVLSRAVLYLGNDSGISHLAGAVGAMGAVIYGPTDPRRWRPAAGRLVTLRARTAAPDGIPLAALPPARVIAACRRRFALTRGDPEISVGKYDSATHRGRAFK